MDIDQEWVKTNIDLIMKQFRIINPEFNTDRLSKEKKKILEDCDKPKYRPIYYIVKTMPDKIDRIKIYAINALTMGVTTFTNLEVWLKIILLVVTIGYTVTKWVKLRNRK